MSDPRDMIRRLMEPLRARVPATGDHEETPTAPTEEPPAAAALEETRPEAGERLADPAHEEPAFPAAPVRGGGRLPNWRTGEKADLDDLVDRARWWESDEADQDQAAPDPKAAEPDTGADEAAEDADTDDGDGDEPDAESGGEKRRAARPPRRWGVRGSGERVYSRPSYYGGTPNPARSLIEAWGGMRPVTRHGLYNGAALGFGWYLGVPQWVTGQTRFLVAVCDSWTEARLMPWYVAVCAVWMFDHSSRRWFPPFALVARMPLVSLIVGLLLYGNPA